MTNNPLLRPCMALVYLVLSGIAGVGPAFGLDAQAIFGQNENAVFQIRVINRETGKKSGIGSGFIFDRPNRLATNYHVVSRVIEKPETFELRYLAADGREGALRLAAVDVVHDLALLEAGDRLGPPLRVAAPPAKGAALFAMGNPLDLGLTIAAGTNGGVLNQTDESRILFSGSLNPGMSGGPTFDDRGTVVGINVSTARNDISFIVPTRYLERLAQAQTLSSAPPLAGISEQIRSYQEAYLDGIIAAVWPETRIRQMRVPGTISPTVRCWDASPKRREELLYRRLSISCKNENAIYLTDRLEAGKILYEYIWIETDRLEPARFYRLYRALNNSQFGGSATEDDVDRFRCDTHFVDVNGREFKATLCARGYQNYPGLSDVLFTAAMIGDDDRGFIFNLDLSGTDFAAANRLVKRFLRDIAWQP